MRSIIRFSVDGEVNGVLRNRLNEVLRGAGYLLNPNVTATYEAANISEADLAAMMGVFWQTATSLLPEVKVDHVWMYADNPIGAAQV